MLLLAFLLFSAWKLATHYFNPPPPPTEGEVPGTFGQIKQHIDNALQGGLGIINQTYHKGSNAVHQVNYNVLGHVLNMFAKIKNPIGNATHGGKKKTNGVVKHGKNLTMQNLTKKKKKERENSEEVENIPMEMVTWISSILVQGPSNITAH